VCEEDQRSGDGEEQSHRRTRELEQRLTCGGTLRCGNRKASCETTHSQQCPTSRPSGGHASWRAAGRAPAPARASPGCVSRQQACRTTARGEKAGVSHRVCDHSTQRAGAVHPLLHIASRGTACHGSTQAHATMRARPPVYAVTHRAMHTCPYTPAPPRRKPLSAASRGSTPPSTAQRPNLLVCRRSKGPDVTFNNKHTNCKGATGCQPLDHPNPGALSPTLVPHDPGANGGIQHLHETLTTAQRHSAQRACLVRVV
jgi:hypothetical protein